MKIEVDVKSKRSVNYYIKKVWKDYHKYASKRERIFDKSVPFILSTVVVLLSSLFIDSYSNFLGLLKDFNNTSLAVIAIIAGFNTASLSVIAASNFSVLGKLFGSDRVEDNCNDDNNKEQTNLLRQTVSFFGYAILTELLILIVGVILIFLFNIAEEINFTNSFLICGIKWTISFLAIPWVTSIFHSLFISVRNITLLYSYVLLVGHEANKENKLNGKNDVY